MHVRSPEEAIDLLRGGQVEEISLDHDLGLDVGPRERTGYDVLPLLEGEVALGRACARAAIQGPFWKRRRDQAHGAGNRVNPGLSERT
jgi:hypothetical protein